MALILVLNPSQGPYGHLMSLYYIYRNVCLFFSFILTWTMVYVLYYSLQKKNIRLLIPRSRSG